MIDVTKLTTAQIAELDRDQIESITIAQIRALTVSQLSAFDYIQSLYLSDEQQLALTDEQVVAPPHVPYMYVRRRIGRNFSKTFADSGLSQNQLNRLAHDVTRGRGR